MGQVVQECELYFGFNTTISDGGAKDVYVLHGSTHTVDAGVSGITTGTTAPPLLSLLC
jgi:hypothetical protein